MASRPRLIAPAAVESYSVLTRLPPPHRAHPSIVHAFIIERFPEPFLTLSETGYQELLATVAAGQIIGGPACDALIAFTAAEHQATLLSLDQRATQPTKPSVLRLSSSFPDDPAPVCSSARHHPRRLGRAGTTKGRRGDASQP